MCSMSYKFPIFAPSKNCAWVACSASATYCHDARPSKPLCAIVDVNTSTKSVFVPSKDSSKELVRFINLQCFDGCFNLDDSFCQVFEKDLGNLQLSINKNKQ